MKRGWLIAIYCIIVATGCIDACGITTHTEIAHRAAHNYEYLLHNTTSIKQVSLFICLKIRPLNEQLPFRSYKSINQPFRVSY